MPPAGVFPGHHLGCVIGPFQFHALTHRLLVLLALLDRRMRGVDVLERREALHTHRLEVAVRHRMTHERDLQAGVEQGLPDLPGRLALTGSGAHRAHRDEGDLRLQHRPIRSQEKEVRSRRDHPRCEVHDLRVRHVRVREDTEIDLLVDIQPAAVHLQDGEPPCLGRERDLDDAVKPSRAEECLVQDIDPVRCTDDLDIPPVLEPVHAGQELHQGTLDFPVTGGVGLCPRCADCIDLVGTEFESEALYYLALGLSNWAIARKCSLSQRGVESRLAALYEKLAPASPVGTPAEAYDRLAYNPRTRAFFEALRRGLLNADELEHASRDLESWIEADRRRHAAEVRAEERS